jgi:hypothetical protein
MAGFLKNIPMDSINKKNTIISGANIKSVIKNTRVTTNITITSALEVSLSFKLLVFAFSLYPLLL